MKQFGGQNVANVQLSLPFYLRFSWRYGHATRGSNCYQTAKKIFNFTTLSPLAPHLRVHPAKASDVSSQSEKTIEGVFYEKGVASLRTRKGVASLFTDTRVGAPDSGVKLLPKCKKDIQIHHKMPHCATPAATPF